MTTLDLRWRRQFGLRLLTLLGLLLGLLATGLPVAATPAGRAAAPTPVTTGVPRFEAAPCDYTLGKGLMEGQNINCGYVVVAEKHANPGGKTIKLPVAVVKAISATPAPEPIVLLAGGPGQSGQVFATGLATEGNFYKGLAANNDVVFFDQRGTGKAQPSLTCPELDGTSNRLRLKMPMFQTFADDDPIALANQCRDRLTAAGADLSAYTTTENAADVNDVRIALGYGKINILGASYGSELGLAVARDWGQYVRTNNLASLVPLEVAWYFEPPQSFDRAIKELARDCAANAACNAAYPNLLATFQKAVNDLNAKPALLTIRDPQTGKDVGQVPLTGDDFVLVLFQLMYSTEIIPFAPDMIARTARGNYTWLENLLVALLGQSQGDPLALGMHFSVVCSKDPSQAALNAALEADKGILPEVRRALEPDLLVYYGTCQGWPSKNADPKGTSPAKSDVPTTLVSGQFDPITPPKYADIARQSLSNATAVTLPGGGHSAIGGLSPVTACGLGVMISLIRSGTTADTACAAQLRTTYRALPPAISGDPAPSPSPSASPSPTTTPTPRPSTPPSPVPSPPATGNGGYPGLPNTGAGAANAPAPPFGGHGWLVLGALLIAPLTFALRRRFGRS